LEIVANFRFHRRKQQLHENIKTYSITLKKMAEECGFVTFLDTALRNQFVYGVTNTKLQQRLLESEDLTFEKAMKMALSMEISSKAGQELQEKVIKSESTINRIDGKQAGKNWPKTHQSEFEKNSNQKQCYRCGSNDHMANVCKHIKSICSFCNKTGHLRRVCTKAKATVSQNTQTNKSNTSSYNFNNSYYKKNKKK
jgi:hypothetical protein